MADHRSNVEIRRDICKEDSKKDVHIHLGVFIAVLAGISAAGAVIATLSVGFLEQFRLDVKNRWMSVLPLAFPIITGVALAYRKQLGNVGLHIALLMATMLSGGFGYAFSVEPIYYDRLNCTDVSFDRGTCDKEMLVFVYVYGGAVACGFAVLGLLVSCCACSKATKNRSKREYDEMIKAQSIQEEKNRKVKHVKQSAPSAPRQSIAPTPAPAKVNGNATNGTANGIAPDNATTHL